MQPTVLIIEDDPDVAEALLTFINAQGHGADVAGDGSKALELLSKRDYMVVISDIILPVMSGIECLVKCRLRNIITPFAFLTGSRDLDLVLSAVRLGAADFLRKPFNVDDFNRMFLKLVESSRVEQEMWSLINAAMARTGQEEQRQKVESLRFRLGGLRVLMDKDRS